jgi:MFS transporter, FSR family, fosmidomycin resistance protein
MARISPRSGSRPRSDVSIAARVPCPGIVLERNANWADTSGLMTTSSGPIGETSTQTGAPSRRRVLTLTCGAHALHDGYTDALYILLPIWQAEFALSYAAVGLLRGLYSGVMALFQIAAADLAARLGAPWRVLALGTAIAGAGYGLAGLSLGLPLLAAGLILGGIGSSTQHPIGSALVAEAFHGNAARPALGAYNFAGDIGKMAFPAAASLLLTFMSWRHTAFALAAAGFIAAALILLLASRMREIALLPAAEADTPAGVAPPLWQRSFITLLAIGIVDSATRMGFMTFLPFLLAAKGASLPVGGLALSLVFAGGACGKLACGFLGARLGVARTITVTKAATALLVLAALALPLVGVLILLPLIGVVLNGTSSVTYGSVPDCCAREAQGRAFGVFYTATIGAGAAAPILFGLISDKTGLNQMMILLAAVALITLPLAWYLPASILRKT